MLELDYSAFELILQIWMSVSTILQTIRDNSFSVSPAFKLRVFLWRRSTPVIKFTCLYVWVYLCVYVWVYLCVYVWVYLCLYVWVYLCLYVWVYLCVYVWVYLCLYVWVYLCVYVKKI